jgi:hypothetical protein
MHHSWLLTIDALINLVLGVLLLVFPAGLVSALGVLPAQVAFYPSILGAVLVGIGIALVIERARGSSGLGLAGAISINMSAGLVLAAWLLIGSLDIPLRGQVLLWRASAASNCWPWLVEALPDKRINLTRPSAAA